MQLRVWHFYFNTCPGFVQMPLPFIHLVVMSGNLGFFFLLHFISNFQQSWSTLLSKCISLAQKCVFLAHTTIVSPVPTAMDSYQASLLPLFPEHPILTWSFKKSYQTVSSPLLLPILIPLRILSKLYQSLWGPTRSVLHVLSDLIVYDYRHFGSLFQAYWPSCSSSTHSHFRAFARCFLFHETNAQVSSAHCIQISAQISLP